MKVSDYIAKFLGDLGVRQVFMVTGGGAMHLNDSFGNEPRLKCLCHHHEQACAIAAEGAARVSEKLQVVSVTTGPGGLNTLTGVMGQWTDSVPVLYVSGQVKQETTIQSCPSIPLRQLGDQEVDIVSIVKPLTKYAVTIEHPQDVRRCFEEAVHHATSGRPGPVWINVPMNVQGANIAEDALAAFSPPRNLLKEYKPEQLCIEEIVTLFASAERPVILAGRGVHVSRAETTLIELAQQFQIPVVTTLNGFDLIASDHPQFVGRVGSQGTRAGNFALQNSDLLLSIGTRNNVRQVSYNWRCFARFAKKIIVDIDSAELTKPTLKPDIAVCCDAGIFLQKLLRAMTANFEQHSWNSWSVWCRERRERYPACLPEYSKPETGIHPYYFSKLLSEMLGSKSIIVTANGTANVAYFQAASVKQGQRVVWNSGCAAMGYELPAAIGACFETDKGEVICIAGDGSMQMNVQELATLAHHGLPIKIFLFNNSGYASIRQTQRNFFGRLIGCDPESGLTCPDFVKVAQAYGLSATRVTATEDLPAAIKAALASTGPCLVDVVLCDNYIFAPKVASEKKPDGRMVSKPLEDMFPFLERGEFLENMLVPEWEEQ